MKLADSVMAAKTSEGSIKWQLCYDISARTWWMVSWQEPEQFFFSSSFFFPLFFRGKKKTSLPFLHMQKERQKHLCFVKIPFLLHIQLLVMSALFLYCLLALHSDNSALLVLWLSSSFVFSLMLSSLPTELKIWRWNLKWSLSVPVLSKLLFALSYFKFRRRDPRRGKYICHFCTSGSSFLYFHRFLNSSAVSYSAWGSCSHALSSSPLIRYRKSSTWYDS